jgi:hypothetical protein
LALVILVAVFIIRRFHQRFGYFEVVEIIVRKKVSILRRVVDLQNILIWVALEMGYFVQLAVVQAHENVLAA